MLTCLQRCNDDVTTHLRPRLGVLAADLRDYHSTLEITVFFTMHFVLILFPLYHLYRETFPVLVRFLIIVLTCFWNHSLLLHLWSARALWYEC